MVKLSPNDTVVTGIGASLTDRDANVWTIDSAGQITVNGTVDTTTGRVDELALDDNGVVWQKNADNHWYSKTFRNAPWGSPWVYWTGPAAPLPIPGVSANDATILAGGTAGLVDANGNVWKLSENSAAQGYQVSVDGAVDATTSHVVEMAIVNGTIWQENTSALWYSKTAPSSTWSNPTSIDPLTGSAEPISLAWVGGGNNQASNPADWSPAVAPAAGDRLSMPSGTMNLTGNALAGDTLAVTAGATVTIDVSGAATLGLSVGQGAHVNIDIAATGTLALTDATGAGYLDVSGGTLSFIGSSVLPAFDTKLSDSILGTGTVGIYGGNASGSFVEINGPVAGGVTFDVSAPGPSDAGLQIDNPATFAGTAELQSGYVALMGVTATSGELLHGVLDLFNGSKIVDTLKFVSSPNEGATSVLALQQNKDGAMLSIGIGDAYQPGGIGTLLPLQT